MRRVYSAREIDSALSKKGFRRDNGHDHVFYYLTLANGGNAGIKTKISHGVTGETIDVNLASLMARQLRLTKPNFSVLLTVRFLKKITGRFSAHRGRRFDREDIRFL